MKRALLLGIVLSVIGVGCRSVPTLPPGWGTECPNPLTFTIPAGAKEVRLKRWRGWGAFGTNLDYEYLVGGVTIGKRSYYQPDGMFKKRKLTGQTLFYRGKLHGLVIETAGSGRRTEGYFRLGKRHGTTKVWMSDGRLDEVAEYRDDKRNGPTSYPILNKVSTFKNDEKNGLEVWKTRGYMGFDNTVYIHSNYENGTLNGATKVFGDVEAKELLLEMDYADGQLNGWVRRYSSGRLEYETFHSHGNQRLIKLFNDAETLIDLSTMNGNAKHGVSVHWNADGTVDRSSFHIDGYAVSEAVYRQKAGADSSLPQIGASLKRSDLLKWLESIYPDSKRSP